MTPDPDVQLRRRLRFQGDCRYLFDRLGAPLGSRLSLHRIPERLAVTAFDLLESARAGRKVPFLGNPRVAIGTASGRLPQHPRYRGYWDDPGRNVLVGMELGVDVLWSGGAYYILEINLSTGRPAAWPELFPGRMDPGLVRLAAFVRNRGFARLVALRKRWPPAYRALFPKAGRQEGVEMVAVDSAGTRGRSEHRLVALPVPLEPDTMYVIYSTRHTAVDHFVHDKACTTEWLPQHLAGDARPPVRSVPTRHEPFTPPPQEDPRWPDLVIKLASWDRGDFVRFVKLKPGEDVLPQLRMKRPSDVPGIFRMGAGRRLVSHLTARDRVLYQPFLPISLDDAGRPIRFRMNVLATPVGGAFLSANAIVSAVPLPAELPYGPVRDADPFLVSYSHGSRYQTCDPATEEDLRGVAEVLVSALDRAVRATFETGP